MTPASDQEGMPLILIPGLFSIGGAFNDGMATAIDSFQAGEQLSWLRGKHSVRVGFDYERVRNNVDIFAIKRGGLLLLSFPDFLLGLSAAQNGTPFSNIFLSVAASGITERQFRANNWASFLQDDWKVHPRLTLNLGLRWEIHGQLSETRGRLANFRPEIAGNDFSSGGTLSGFVTASNFAEPLPDGVVRNANSSCCQDASVLGNWGPRIGLAWQPLARNRRLVVRTGYGVFYSRTSGNDVMQLVLQQPYLTLADASGPANALATLQVPFNPALPSTSAHPLWKPRGPTTQLALANLAFGWNSPKAQQYSLNLQYELGADTLLELGYVGTRGTRLLRFREVNQARLASPQNPVNGVTTNTLANVASRVPVLGLTPSGLRQMETDGFLWHNALLATLNKRFRHGLQYQLAYTFGKTLDDTPASAGFTSVWGGFFSNDVNDRRQAWGLADFNRRHRLVAYYVWELPQPDQRKGVIAVLANGWQVSGVATFQSGRPLTVIDQRAGSIYGASSTLFFSSALSFVLGPDTKTFPRRGRCTTT
ncbi:MAG: TonB-dependent receptor [Acidobacteria bacterium]|nr:TonB-dependent receptor [Acidobacteriota bacterium]